MMIPSVKGVLLIGPVSAVRKAIREDRLQREAVELRLDPDDIRFLDEKVDPTRWYPVGALGRFLEIMVTLSSTPRAEALYGFGAAALDTVMATERYQQLNFEEGKLQDAPTSERRLATRILTSVWGAFYNFGRFEVDYSANDTPRIQYLDVEPLPETIRPTIEGFMAAVTSRSSGRKFKVTSQRPTPDRIVFTHKVI